MIQRHVRLHQILAQLLYLSFQLVDLFRCRGRLSRVVMTQVLRLSQICLQLRHCIRQIFHILLSLCQSQVSLLQQPLALFKQGQQSSVLCVGLHQLIPKSLQLILERFDFHSSRSKMRLGDLSTVLSFRKVVLRLL